MQKITCEVCFSNQFIRDDDFFICEHCGTKYTVSAIQKMLVEGVVKIDSSEEQQNLEVLLERAYTERKMSDLLQYANDLLRSQPTHFQARLYKIIATPYTIAPSANNLLQHVKELWQFYEAAGPEQAQLSRIYLFEFSHSIIELSLASVQYHHAQHGSMNHTQHLFFSELTTISNALFNMKRGFEDHNLVDDENEFEIAYAFEQAIVQIVIQLEQLWVKAFRTYYNGVLPRRGETASFFYSTLKYIGRTYFYDFTQSSQQQIREAYLSIYHYLQPITYKSEIAGINRGQKVVEPLKNNEDHVQILLEAEQAKQKAFNEKYKKEQAQLAAVYEEIDSVKARLAKLNLLQFKEKKQLEAKLSLLRRETETIKNAMK